MSIITRPRSKEEVDQMIADLTETTKNLLKSKKTARDFLHGYITKTGRLTKRYGG